MEKTKICPRCKRELKISEFSKNKNTKDGLQSWCKYCCSEGHAEWCMNNQDKKKEDAAKWYLENREQVLMTASMRRKQNPDAQYTPQRYEQHLQRKYGIGLFEYDEILEAQGNRCLICGKTPEENRRRLSVDHDHKTGEVRGLLCKNCNKGIGLFQDNPHLLRSATNYLERFK